MGSGRGSHAWRAGGHGTGEVVMRGGQGGTGHGPGVTSAGRGRVGPGCRGARPAFWATFLWADVTCLRRPVRGPREGTPRAEGVFTSPRNDTQNHVCFPGCRFPALLAAAVGDLGLEPAGRGWDLGGGCALCGTGLPPPGGMGGGWEHVSPNAATRGKFLPWRLARGTVRLKYTGLMGFKQVRVLQTRPC